MGVRDALLLNQTGSNFQALQTNDTARLKGDLSLQKDDGTEVLGIDVSTATLNLTGGITGSGNISSSLSSTGSFGRVVGTTFHGDGSALKDDLPRSVGIVTQSAQLAAEISGAFTEGFFFSSSISGGLGITASFGKVEASFLFGDGSGVAQTIPRSGLITSSAQLADNISGSFNKGFEFSGAIKTDVAAWTEVATLNTGRQSVGTQGNSATALAAGGAENTGYPFTYSGKTEEWNGTAWSEVNDMTIAKDGGMAGPSTNDAYHGGGAASWNDLQKWNGTNWSTISPSETSLGSNAPAEGGPGVSPGGVRNGYMAGCASDYLYFIGKNNNFTEYDVAGEAAIRCPQLLYGYAAGASGDICTGILAWGGTNPTEGNGSVITECWNGTSWSDTAARLINVPGRVGFRNHRGAGVSSTSAVHIGGEAGPPSGPAWATDCVTHMHQLWDGTSWTVRGEIPKPLRCMGVTGTEHDTFIVGGLQSLLPYGAPYTMMASSSREYVADTVSGSFGLLNFISASGDATELQPSIQYVTNPAFNVLTGSSQIESRISGSFNKGFEFVGQIKGAIGGVFAHSTTMPTAHQGGSGGSMLAGTAIIAGGSYGSGWPPQACACTEVYDGSSWSEVNDLTRGTTDQGAQYVTLSGDSSAALFFGGNTGLTEEWNGTNWSETTETGEYFSYKAGGGGESSEAAIWVGHTYGGRSAVWNGSNWSEISDMIALGSPNREGSSFGTSTSFLIGGGGVTPACFLNTEIWNGSSWSENSDMIVAVNRGAGMGTTNDGVIATGHDGTTPYYSRVPIFESNVWDGTSFSAGSLVNSRRYQNGLGSGTNTANGLANDGWFGGGSPGSPVYNSTLTEIYPGFTISGSFGRIDANKFVGDGSNLSNLPFPTGLVTGSAQLGISGSFTSGFGFSGEISGSATSTGSFGRIEADFLHGDGSSIKDDLPRSTGIISSSKQIAADISGSFTSGFGYEGTIQTTPGGVWSVGGNLNTARTYLAGTGTKTAALAVGGINCNHTEEYNGTSFSEVNNLNGGRGMLVGTGTTEASVFYGGGPARTANTEEWNGTNWSEVNNLIMARYSHAKLGTTSEAALAIGGNTTESGNEDTDVEVWNGTNWSAGTAMPANAGYGSSFGGYDSGIVTTYTEYYCWNGTNWSDEGGLITANRYYDMGAGSSNDGWIAGGYAGSLTPNITATVEYYNGTSWSTGANMITNRQKAGSADSLNTSGGNGMVFGGDNPSALASSEEYSVNVASASFHNIEVTSLSGDGSQFSASLQSQLLTSVTQISNSISGSFTNGFDLQGGVSASLGLYGATWSEVTPLITARAGGVTGTPGAALMSGGRATIPGPYTSTCTEIWNGATWSAANAKIVANSNSRGITGTTEAAISHQVPTNDNFTEIWNGTNWSVGSETNSHQIGGTNMVGTVDAAIEAGGFNGSGGTEDDTAEWNGSAWSEATALPNARGGGSFAGIQNDAMYTGGNVYRAPAYAIEATSVIYNGTNWSTGIPMIVAGVYHAGDGSANSSVHAGGAPYSGNWPQYDTYEFNGLAWYQTANMSRSPASARDIDIAGDPRGALAAGGYIRSETEIYEYASSGSFGQVRGTVGGEITTKMFNITSSTFKLPLFSDADLNYISREPEESTGSISGSVDRVADVNILNKPGNFFFHSDYNALGFTYLSASIYSQSIDFVTCQYASGSVYTSSTGFITQSHYCYHNVIQYITGSYT